MRGSLHVLRSETYRLVRSPSTWFAGGVLLLVPVLRILAARVVETVGQLGGDSSPTEFESGNGWVPLVEGWRTGLALGTLMLLIHAARGLSGDRDSGLLRLAVTRSASRGGLVLGRALLSPALVLAVALLTGLGALGAAAYFHDFGPLVEDGYTILTAEELRAALRSAALASLPPLLATYAFGLLIAALARSAVGGVTLAVGGFLAFDLLKDSLGEAQYWVFAAYAPSFVDGSAMNEMVGVAHGYSDAGSTEELLRMNHLLPWPQAFLFVGLAWAVLGRRRL